MLLMRWGLDPINLTPEGPSNLLCFDNFYTDGRFWVDKYEVSQAQFVRFGGIAEKSSVYTGQNLPRENITWYEAQNFCEKRGGRLPTELEWEYAARGPSEWQFPWGDNWDASRVNGDFAVDRYSFTAPVDSFSSGESWVGALNMSGNVREWTASLKLPYPYDPNDGRENMQSPIFRIARGGAWFGTDILYFRTSYRTQDDPNVGDERLGFRCVRDYVAGE